MLKNIEKKGIIKISTTLGDTSKTEFEKLKVSFELKNINQLSIFQFLLNSNGGKK